MFQEITQYGNDGGGGMKKWEEILTNTVLMDVGAKPFDASKYSEFYCVIVGNTTSSDKGAFTCNVIKEALPQNLNEVRRFVTGGTNNTAYLKGALFTFKKTGDTTYTVGYSYSYDGVQTGSTMKLYGR